MVKNSKYKVSGFICRKGKGKKLSFQTRSWNSRYIIDCIITTTPTLSKCFCSFFVCIYLCVNSQIDILNQISGEADKENEKKTKITVFGDFMAEQKKVVNKWQTFNVFRKQTFTIY